MLHERIYLDHNATTPVDLSVVETMRRYMTDQIGNSSSVHHEGRGAKVALEQARESIAEFINCEPSELLFTSGGTESDNLAILGTMRTLSKRRAHLIVGAAEHHAVLEPAEYLHEREGVALTRIPSNALGLVAPEQLREAVTESTALVSIMHANNETGAVQNIASMTAIAHEQGALFHTDAVQSVGKIPVDVRAMDVDLLSLTGHKIYGPRGAGALFVRSGVKIAPLMYGGSQERRRRPGTENVAAIIGLAKALEIAKTRMTEDEIRLRALSDYFASQLIEKIPDVRINSDPAHRLPQTVHASFYALEGEPIVLSLDIEGIAVSSGSACTAGATEPSHVLSAMGVEKSWAVGAIRFSLGRSTTKEQIDQVLHVLPGVIARLRELSPVRR
jgi:cysteine desulfurase